MNQRASSYFLMINLANIVLPKNSMVNEITKSFIGVYLSAFVFRPDHIIVSAVVR